MAHVLCILITLEVKVSPNSGSCFILKINIPKVKCLLCLKGLVIYTKSGSIFFFLADTKRRKRSVQSRSAVCSRQREDKFKKVCCLSGSCWKKTDWLLEPLRERFSPQSIQHEAVFFVCFQKPFSNVCVLYVHLKFLRTSKPIPKFFKLWDLCGISSALSYIPSTF